MRLLSAAAAAAAAAAATDSIVERVIEVQNDAEALRDRDRDRET
jgi:hypothetical protein